MNRAEYIKELKTYLANLSEEEKNDAIKYCTEYFDEAGMSNEENAIKELGTPRQFANNLIANIAIKNDSKNETVNNKKKNSKSDIKIIWIVLLAIAALPFGLPILIAIVSVLFGLLIAGICIVFTLGVVVFAVPLALIFGFPIGLPFFSDMLFLNSTNGFLIAGVVLLSISMLILSVVVLYNLIKYFIVLIKKIVIAIYSKVNKNK